MKLLGCLLLTASGLCWGLDRARRLGRRADLLVELLRLMQFLRTEIQFSACTLAQLFAMGDDPFSREAVKRPGFSQDPAAALTEAGDALLSRERDRALLRGFAQGLGASGTQGQLEHLELYMGLVRERLREAREEYAQKNRLYIALGLLAGVAVWVVII